MNILQKFNENLHSISFGKEQKKTLSGYILL